MREPELHNGTVFIPADFFPTVLGIELYFNFKRNKIDLSYEDEKFEGSIFVKKNMPFTIILEDNDTAQYKHPSYRVLPLEYTEAFVIVNKGLGLLNLVPSAKVWVVEPDPETGGHQYEKYVCRKKKNVITFTFQVSQVGVFSLEVGSNNYCIVVCK